MTIHIWKINDYEWWAGEGPSKDILDEYMKATGLSHEDSTGDKEDFPVQLTQKAMDKLKFIEDDETEKTFRTKLNEMITEGVKFPCEFACCDY